MTEPIRAPEDTLPTPPAAGDALIAGAIAATVDSAEPMPAAETAQAPRMFGDLASCHFLRAREQAQVVRHDAQVTRARPEG
ncbi:hypothetical protein ACQCSE_26750, partial [Ralstonia pseudosolanacearum]